MPDKVSIRAFNYFQTLQSSSYLVMPVTMCKDINYRIASYFYEFLYMNYQDL